MTASSHTAVRGTLRLAIHSLGALVLASLISALLGAVTGLFIYAAGGAHDLSWSLKPSIGDAAPDSGNGVTNFVLGCGLLSSMPGGILGGVALTSSALFSRSRRKMTAAFERASVLLTVLVSTGVVCTLPARFIVAVWGSGRHLADSPGSSLLVLGIFSSGWSVVPGIIFGVLTVAALLGGILARILVGLLSSALIKFDRSASAGLISGTDTPWQIHATATLMPSAYAKRWRDGFAEAQYDYGSDRSPELLRDFVVHAPATIVWAWIATLRHPISGASDSSGHRR